MDNTGRSAVSRWFHAHTYEARDLDRLAAVESIADMSLSVRKESCLEFIHVSEGDQCGFVAYVVEQKQAQRSDRSTRRGHSHRPAPRR